MRAASLHSRPDYEHIYSTSYGSSLLNSSPRSASPPLMSSLPDPLRDSNESARQYSSAAARHGFMRTGHSSPIRGSLPQLSRPKSPASSKRFRHVLSSGYGKVVPSEERGGAAFALYALSGEIEPLPPDWKGTARSAVAMRRAGKARSTSPDSPDGTFKHSAVPGQSFVG